MGHMKARWTMKCACGCSEPIYVGSEFSSRASRVYKKAHLDRMKRLGKF